MRAGSREGAGRKVDTGLRREIGTTPPLAAAGTGNTSLCSRRGARILWFGVPRAGARFVLLSLSC
ncbi:hypothetical protein GCM10027093_65540 [Paraburkholderia jirisanensis]